MSFAKLAIRIDTYRDAIIELQKELIAIPALAPNYEASPEHTGESRKVAFLKEYLSKHGITGLEEISAPDDRDPTGHRPSLIAKIPGKSHAKTVWVMAHTDIVPPGDLSKWDSDPYELKVDGDRLYGRGVEDNHQGLVAGVMAVRAFVESGVTPEYDVAILFVADEECGSKYGIHYVLDKANPFRPDDLIVVPDGGAADGSEIEVAEKSIMWVKFQLTGKQCHASMPDHGINAMRAGAYLIVELDRLHAIFPQSDDVFAPPRSTFEPTKKHRNVDAVNIIPGDDVFYLDCRILPGIPLAKVDAEIKKMCASVSERFGVTIETTFEQRQEAARATPVDAPIVKRMKKAVQDVYHVEAKPVGIGGGTVAAPLRRKGLPCVVWSRMDETMHSPNENAKISNIIGDAKVIAHLAAHE